MYMCVIAWVLHPLWERICYLFFQKTISLIHGTNLCHPEQSFKFHLDYKMNGLLLFCFIAEPKALTQREQMRKMTIPLLLTTVLRCVVIRLLLFCYSKPLWMMLHDAINEPAQWAFCSTLVPQYTFYFSFRLPAQIFLRCFRQLWFIFISLEMVLATFICKY